MAYFYSRTLLPSGRLAQLALPAQRSVGLGWPGWWIGQPAGRLALRLLGLQLHTKNNSAQDYNL